VRAHFNARFRTERRRKSFIPCGMPFFFRISFDIPVSPIRMGGLGFRIIGIKERSRAKGRIFTIGKSRFHPPPAFARWARVMGHSPGQTYAKHCARAARPFAWIVLFARSLAAGCYLRPVNAPSAAPRGDSLFPPRRRGRRLRLVRFRQGQKRVASCSCWRRNRRLLHVPPSFFTQGRLPCCLRTG
jgi:hypothetical protein